MTRKITIRKIEKVLIKNALAFYVSILSLKPISATAHSHNACWIGRIHFKFLSQPAHMNIHRAAVADEIPAPDALQDEFARKHLAFMLGKKEKQFIFLGLELQRLAIQNHFAAREIDDEII